MSNKIKYPDGMTYDRGKATLLLIFLCLFLSLTLKMEAYPYPYHQSPRQENIEFHRLSIDDGLSQNTIYAILQDKKGFMWFGTQDGLNRYDGYDFKTYKYVPDDPNSLSDNYINALYEDGEGMLWIGTNNGGLNRLDPTVGRITRFQHQPGDPNTLINNVVHAIYEDSRGLLWVGTEDGLDRLDRQTNRFVHYQNELHDTNSLSHNHVRAVAEDQQGKLWIGTWGGGLNRLDPITGTFTRFPSLPDNPNSLTDNRISSIQMCPTGNLYIGTANGLTYFNPSKKTFSQHYIYGGTIDRFAENWVYAIYFSKEAPGDESIWIGTMKGLYRFFYKKKEFTSHLFNPNLQESPTHTWILSFYKDRAGALWIGTGADGVFRINPGGDRFVNYLKDTTIPGSLIDSSVNALCLDQEGMLWIGTGGGVKRLDRTANQFDSYQYEAGNPHSLSHNEAYCIHQDHKGIIWVGTLGGGLNRFDRDKNQFIHYRHEPGNSNSLSHDMVSSIYEDRSGELWITTRGGGLNRLSKDRTHFTHFTHYKHNPSERYSLSSNYVWDICEDQEGYLWIGTKESGLNRFNRITQQFTNYRHNPQDPSSISHNSVLTIVEDSQGALWIGTFGGGLNRLDVNREYFTRFTEKDGMPNNVVYGILEDDDGNIWLSTNRGLSCFNPRTRQFKNYNRSDNLQSNEFCLRAFCKSPGGEMFFGGINGITVFHPQNIKDNPYIPPVVITDFQVFNQSVPIGNVFQDHIILKKDITETEAIELPYKYDIFSFQFAALNYISPKKNQYAYKMEGFEKEWNYVGKRRFAAYTALPPGTYIFRVKGSNNDGVWNEAGVALKITIIPPFWKTWWFYLLCLFGIILSGFGIYRVRIRQFGKRKKELENLVAHRTKQLKTANIELEELSIVARETDNAVIIMDPKGNIEWVNEGFIRMYEDTLKQLIAEQGGNFIESSSNPNIKADICKCINQRVTVTYESLNTTRAGKKIWTQTTLTPILDDNGNVEKLIAIGSDITKIKNAEEAAERANQSKSEFLALVSHEIRTPMNSIIGFSDMLLNTNLNEEQSDYVCSISQSGDALISIINDILDLSRIEAGELSFEPIDFDPEVTTFEICDLIIPRIGTKPIEVLYRVSDNIPAYVTSDVGRFRQVIINLIGNAAKFTEAGEIELSLAVEEEEKERLKLHVKVRDTGIGIPEDKREMIFAAFQQGDNSIPRKYGGTGLGLFICKQIATLMGGDVWTESEPNKGSIFHFTAWVNKSRKKPEKEGIRESLAGKKVLIVDDSKTNREILIEVLTFSKMRCQALSKPDEVIPAILGSFTNNDPFDICIIDIQLPDISGDDVAKEIRKLDSPMSSLPLLAFSSSAIIYCKKYKEIGFDGYLPKPIERKKLLKMVERLLYKKEIVKEKKGKDRILTQDSIIEADKHSVHIILAEDHPINQKLILFMLKKEGYQVSAVKNGKEAVAAYASAPGKYNMILMDVQMPVMDGREATKEIRRLEAEGKSNERQSLHIPIIAVTAEAMKGEREKLLEIGMDDYISKPIKRDVVLEMVNKWGLRR